MRDSSRRYSTTAQLLHWAVAGMIVTQFILAKLAERADEAQQLVRQLGLLANHKSVGITILALAVIRLLWRLFNKPPALPPMMPRWQVAASHVSHWTLYLLLFAMPVTGWLMSSASAYSVSWFNLYQLPDLVAPDPALKETFETVHELLAKVLLVVAGLHILAALKHAVVDRDGVLSRMTSIPALLIFAAVIAAGATWLASPGKAKVRPADAKISLPAGDSAAATPQITSTPEPTADPAIDEPEQPGSDQPVDGNVDPAPTGGAAPEPAGEPALWNIDYTKSHIRFTGDQAGAKFQGEWLSWQAQIRFAEDNLNASNFDVTIDTAQVSTKDDERDEVLADAEWFDSANYPQAYYRASRFEAAGDGSFVAHGQLTIKDSASPVDLAFTVTSDGQQRVLEASSSSRVLLGQALLDRLALGVGTGEWEDTEWVGQSVQVDVRVQATLAPTDP